MLAFRVLKSISDVFWILLYLILAETCLFLNLWTMKHISPAAEPVSSKGLSVSASPLLGLQRCPVLVLSSCSFSFSVVTGDSNAVLTLV